MSKLAVEHFPSWNIVSLALMGQVRGQSLYAVVLDLEFWSLFEPVADCYP